MGDDRNLTVHTYSEKTARQLYQRLPKYYRLIKNIVGRIKEEVKGD